MLQIDVCLKMALGIPGTITGAAALLASRYVDFVAGRIGKPWPAILSLLGRNATLPNLASSSFVQDGKPGGGWVIMRRAGWMTPFVLLLIVYEYPSTQEARRPG
jgi:hypothetical protein